MIRFKSVYLLAATPLLLSLTGCVAAIPFAMQAVSGSTSMAQLCAAAKLPGQSATLCDRIPLAANSAPRAGTTVR